ncbi:hypothetical protein Pan216_28720 [Planctomycetes bacterium Pan216]|uniref:DUF4112 domain-containing protein n=1 Tax=Kolteria novifilia TaxID=2527975 RepID=A0A518B4Y1_9BACT|nr:hypothetical protein Pan216_28720 [Planctomycetes bacterium Pan216]
MSDTSIAIAEMDTRQKRRWSWLGSSSRRFERINRLARFLDSAVHVPGTNFRVGFDALIGLLPGVGDILSAGLASYIVFEARQLGVPKRKLFRMVWNVAVDSVIGAIPIVGDWFDIAYKANRKNLDIVREHLGERRDAADS